MASLWRHFQPIFHSPDQFFRQNGRNWCKNEYRNFSGLIVVYFEVACWSKWCRGRLLPLLQTVCGLKAHAAKFPYTPSGRHRRQKSGVDVISRAISKTLHRSNKREMAKNSSQRITWKAPSSFLRKNQNWGQQRSPEKVKFQRSVRFGRRTIVKILNSIKAKVAEI